jgi:hypothetical protein
MAFQRTLYRSLLRDAKALEKQALQRSLPAHQELHRFDHHNLFPTSDPIFQSPSPLYQIVREEFRYHRLWTDNDEISELTALALKALRVSRRRIAALSDKAWRPRPSNVTFAVGQIV